MTTATTRKITGAMYDKGGAVFNIQHPDYGGVWGGTADNSAAINLAIVDAIAAKGSVFFPPSSVDYIAKNLAVTGSVSFWCIPGTATLKLKPLTALDGSPLFNVTASDVTIDGLMIDGNKAAHTADGFSDSYDTGANNTGRAYRAAIKMKDTGSLWSGLTVKNVKFKNTYGACVATLNIAKVRLTDCQADSCNFELGFLYSNTAGASYFKGHYLRGNRVTNCGSGHLTVNADAFVLTCAENFSFVNNDVDGVERCALKCEYVRHGVITGGEWSNNTKDNFEALQFQSSSEDITVSGFNIFNFGRGISLNPQVGQLAKNITVGPGTIETTTGTGTADGFTLGSGAFDGLTLIGLTMRDIKRYCISLQPTAACSNLILSSLNLYPQATTSASGIFLHASGGNWTTVKLIGVTVDHGTANSSGGLIVFDRGAAETMSAVSVLGCSIQTLTSSLAFRETAAIITDGIFDHNQTNGLISLPGAWDIGRHNICLGAAVTDFSAVSNARTVLTTPYTLAATDYIVAINLTVAGAVALTLPTLPRIGRDYVIKDTKGDAATNNITFGGSVDGTTLSIKENYGSVTVYHDGTGWRLRSRAHRPSAGIASPNTQTAAYVQADVQSLKTAIDAIRSALSKAQITQ